MKKHTKYAICVLILLLVILIILIILSYIKRYKCHNNDNCSKNGECKNGECECKSGFAGYNCSQSIEKRWNDTTVPAIMLMRHGKEFDSIKDIPPNIVDKTYNFLDNLVELTHDEQTLDTTKCYGIPHIENLYNRLKDKIKDKYKPIDTIITINPKSLGYDAPTKNPFLTAYHFVKGASSDNIIKVGKLFDSKDVKYGKDGYNNINILPETLDDYIKITGNSVLVIVTRDTLWGDGNQPLSTPDENRLLNLYKKYYKTKSVIYPYKAQILHVFSGIKGSGELDILDFTC
jgi:hypothetical protein